MTPELKILFVEDSPIDMELTSRELKTGGVPHCLRRVQTRDDLLRELDLFEPDLVLSDYNMPGFDGLEALSVVRFKRPETPFVFVSGNIGEDRAIEAVRSGATDYVLKDRLSRLVPCVRRAVREVAEREERRRMEGRIRDSESRFRAIFDDAAVGIVLLDREARILQANPVFRDMLGYSGEEIGRFKVTELTHPDDVEVSLDLFEDLAEGRRSSYQLEKRFLRKDSAVVWTRLTASRIKTPADSPPLLLGMVEDITQRKRLEEQLNQSQKMEAVGQLAGGVAHDFNNLICVINGYSDLVLAALEPHDRRRGDVEQIRKAGQRAAGLTRQLLAFSRRQIIQPRVLDLSAVVFEMEKMLSRLIGENITLEARLKADIGCVRADPGQIEQVIMNLAVNARDAMPQGGKLTIALAAADLDAEYARLHHDVVPGPYILLSVSDTGTGIPQQTLPRIFEPFFSTKGPGKGTGLGLSTVYGIIKQSGGHLAVYSEEGIGTTFKVYLPRVEGGPEAGAKAEEAACAARGEELVLVVEDEEGLRDLLRRQLSSAGYSVLSARNADEGLRLIEENRDGLRLLLTDLVMPGGGGRELSVRAAVLAPRSRTVFMSGYTDDAVVRNGLIEEGLPFLGKPFSAQALLSKVREALDGPGLEGAAATGK